MNLSHTAPCRVKLTVLLMLAAMSAVSPALGHQAGGAESVYASPHGGWSISWSAPWRPGSEEDRRSIQAELLLTNGRSLVAMAAIASEAVPADCVDQMGYSMAAAGFTPAGGSTPATDEARAWGTYRSLDLGAWTYVECREVAPGKSMLAILHVLAGVTTRTNLEEEIQSRESLLDGLMLSEESTPSGATPAPAPTIAEAGVIAGVVTDFSGQPIPGVTIIVTEQDTATMCTFEQPFGTFEAPCSRSIGIATDDDGRYLYEASTEPTLKYAVDAYHVVPLGGDPYAFPLYPVDGDRSYESAASGIVEDFTWLISGRVPVMDGFQDLEAVLYPADFYGGSLDVVDALENVDPLAGRYPADASIELVLEPRGPMIDGSQGQTVHLRVGLDGEPMDGPDTYLGYLLDVPVGPYDVMAKVILPDGEVEPLLVSVDCGYSETADDFADSDELEFRPDPLYVPMALGGIETVTVCVAAR